jgi:hypothetical protein
LEQAVGADIIARNGPDRVMFWARLPSILVACLLGLLIYLWGRQVVGNLAALGALTLFALDPTVIAHSFLVTTDVGLAMFTVLLCFALWNYLRQPSLRRRLLCGLALGAALGAKFSAVALAPVAAVLLLAARRWPADPQAAGPPPRRDYRAGPNDPCPCGSGKKYKKCHGLERGASARGAASVLRQPLAAALGTVLVIGLVALVFVQALYLFPTDPSLYLTGLRRVNADHHPGYRMFLAGALAPHFPWYFAAAYLLKEPIASIVLAGVGLAALLRSTKLTVLHRLFLLLPPAVLFAGYSAGAANVGIRYIIPVLPFLYLVGGLGFATLLQARALWKRGAAALLVLWLAIAAAAIYPDHLSYFNETACLFHDPAEIGLDGGTRCGPLWLDDSNVDWGQGLKQLQAWIDEQAKGRAIRLAYFGTYPPERYGLRYEALSVEELRREPPPGLLVVSAHMLARVPALPGARQWLRQLQPAAIVGRALYVYDIPKKNRD